MFAWFETLSVAGQMYAVLAIPATALLVLQVILLLFDLDQAQTEGKAEETPDPALRERGKALSFAGGILSLFSLGGWSGIAFSEAGMAPVLTFCLSLAVGLLALFLAVLLIRQLQR